MTQTELIDALATLCDPTEGYYPRMPMPKRMADLWRETLLPYPVERLHKAIHTYASHNPLHPPSLSEIEKMVKPRGVVL
jgi:hypothetical protein